MMRSIMLALMLSQEPCCELVIPPFAARTVEIEPWETKAIGSGDPADAIATELRLNLMSSLRPLARDGAVRRIKLASRVQAPTMGLRVLNGFSMVLPANGQSVKFGGGAEPDLVLFLDHVSARRDVKVSSDFDESRGKLELSGAFAIWDNRAGSVRCAGRTRVSIKPWFNVTRDHWRELSRLFAEQVMKTSRCSQLFAP